jgi:hypothetical protein
MTRIFIENNELDLTQALSRQITYAVDDLQNLDSKATSFSKTIVIPGTARNNALLGNIFDFNNSNFTNDVSPNIAYNFNASKSAACRIEVNGLQIVKGIFRLTEILYDGDNVEYETAIFGELGGFIAKLGNGRLEDLDFSAYNHDYTIANITNSWNDAGDGSGYVYPHVDYGTYSTNKTDWKYRTFRPALFVKEYIEKIVSNSGYTIEFPLKETARFKSLIVPHNQKRLTRVSSNFLAATFYRVSTENVDDFYYADLSASNLGDFIIQVVGGGVEELKYTGAAPLTGTLTINADFSFSGGANVDLRFYHNANILATISSSGLLNYTNTAFTFNTNDTLSIVMAVQGADPTGMGNYAALSLSGTIDFTGNKPELVLVNLGEPVVVNDTIPRNVFQRDFFISILKLFNLYVVEDKFVPRKLVVKPYTDFYTGEIEDWSGKMDRAKQISIKPMSEVNARFYNFKFKDDSDFYLEQYKKRYNEGYGDRIFDNGLEFAKDTETVDINFASTVLVGYTGEDKVYSTIFKQSNGNEETIDSVIRILQAKKITGVASWHIHNDSGGGNLHTGTVYCYAGHFDDPVVPTNDINFGAPLELFFVLVSGAINVNQFNLYYSSYMAEITDKDSRLLTAYFKLNEQDIFNLDFAKFKYIDGGLYRLSKVMDYDAGANELTKCELLRVINTTY